MMDLEKTRRRAKAVDTLEKADKAQPPAFGEIKKAAVQRPESGLLSQPAASKPLLSEPRIQDTETSQKRERARRVSTLRQREEESKRRSDADFYGPGAEPQEATAWKPFQKSAAPSEILKNRLLKNNIRKTVSKAPAPSNLPAAVEARGESINSRYQSGRLPGTGLDATEPLLTGGVTGYNNLQNADKIAAEQERLYLGQQEQIQLNREFDQIRRYLKAEEEKQRRAMEAALPNASVKKPDARQLPTRL